MGPPQTVQGAGHWYLIARHGDRVTRLRPRASLGETESGELSFERSFAQLELDIADDGGLVISTLGDHEIESAGGSRRHYERLVRDRGAEIRLAHNVLLLDVDFVEESQEQRPSAEPARPPRAAARSTADLLAQRLPPFPAVSVGTSTQVEPAPLVAPIAHVPEVRVPTEQMPSEQVSTEQVPTEQVPIEQVLTEQVPTEQIVAPATQTPAPVAPNLSVARRQRRTLQPRLAALAAVAVIAVTLTWLASRDGDAPESSPTVADRAERTPPAPAPVARVKTEQTSPTASVRADPAPTAPTVAKSPPVIPPRTSTNARLARTTDQPPPATAAPTAVPKKAPTVASAPPAAEPAKAQLAVAPREQVPTPAPTPAPIVAVAPDPKVVANPSAAPPSSPVSAVQTPVVSTKTPDVRAPSVTSPAAQNGESSEKQAQEMVRTTLLAANQALADGRLTAPTQTSAYTLFSEVLKLEPGSQEAANGLKSVREALINRTLAELAGRSLNDARKSLQAASEMGADPMLVANLQDEIDYQQRMSSSPTENQ